jgi:signal transduction histidine kinase
MNPRRWLAQLWSGLRHPQATVRWRLTLLYGGLFLICGAGLLAITYTLLSSATTVSMPLQGVVLDRGPSAPSGIFPKQLAPPGDRQLRAPVRFPPFVPARVRRALASNAGRAAVRFVVGRQRVSDLHHLEVESGIALAIMALISGLLGWLMAGRVLRPLRTMTVTTQQISEVSLHRRLAMPGPRDELRQLADTIDGLLGRLERAFDAQRQFVANASHELRTPLTTARALLEMVLSDPHATAVTFRETCHHVLLENEQQEQLIDALLTLAQGQRGLERRDLVDLQALVASEVDRHETQALAADVQSKVCLEPAQVYGDQRLLGRLVSNLVENAIRHNESGGQLEIGLAAAGPCPVLRISNTGAALSVEDARRILQPFQRLAPNRTTTDGGLGLGLSIVAAIAQAHGAQLDLRPRRGGGLEVRVLFGASPAREEPIGRSATAELEAPTALELTTS